MESTWRTGGGARDEFDVRQVGTSIAHHRSARLRAISIETATRGQLRILVGQHLANLSRAIVAAKS
jgi:hypothetical protein